MRSGHRLNSGAYFIGDLCYVLDSVWPEFCAKAAESSDGYVRLDSGHEVLFSYTKYGDGLYRDNEGYKYPVDSGLIGCVLISQTDQMKVLDDEAAYDELEYNGRCVVLPYVTMDVQDGVISFLDIEIDTR